MDLLRAVQKVADWMERILRVCVVASLAGVAGVVNLSVFFRYVLHAPLSWSNEAARYLLVFTVVLAAAIALRHLLFVNVRVLVDLLPAPVRRILVPATRVLIGAFLVVAIVSPEAMIEKAVRTNTISPAMSLPMALVYRVMQAGFAVMLLFLLFGLVDRAILRERRRPPEDLQ